MAITDHHVNDCNKQIRVEGFHEAFGTPSVYVLTPPQGKLTRLFFQNGPIKEVGINGITNEALLAVVADRLRNFQRGPFACKENALAFQRIQEALGALHSRTARREKAGVEGTNVVDKAAEGVPQRVPTLPPVVSETAPTDPAPAPDVQFPEDGGPPREPDPEMEAMVDAAIAKHKAQPPSTKKWPGQLAAEKQSKKGKE